MIQDLSPKNVTLDLHVQCATLYSKVNPTPQEIEDSCTLSDDNGGSLVDGDGVKNFQSNVYKNYKVYWIGKSSDTGFEVIIESIVKKNIANNFNLFDKPTILGQNNGEVSVKVRDNSDVVNKIYSYLINFSIYKIGEEQLGKSYSIDPKLKGNP